MIRQLLSLERAMSSNALAIRQALSSSRARADGFTLPRYTTAGDTTCILQPSWLPAENDDRCEI